jgi:hypothetical protein
MSMVDTKSEDAWEPLEGREELNAEVVATIEVMRSWDQKLVDCVNKRKVKEESWGPTLVERQRRRPNNGTNVMQRAMELKKNLEPLKGNAFATLHVENLSNIATDVSLKLGSSSVEMDFIVKNLVEEDAKKIENFVVENPEMKLPINSDIEEAMLSQPLDGEGVQNSVIEGSVMLG